ncbi:MAG: methylated-DNA--[protein]-cysteine S-methyltransferase [Alphaproteobacteria bacterium]|nr:methylated-DNA--[protein]-cysteine S-methyltransferase [Alphaproteobacteria bacterium]
MKVILQQISAHATRGSGLTLVYGIHNFPVGKILIAMTDEKLCWLGITCKVKYLREDWKGAEIIEDTAITSPVASEIVKYWPKALDKLSVPIVLYGTEFQLNVWAELLKIKSGTTITYGQIAEKIGKPKASRAVGSTISKNTVSIIVPCHRVVHASSGKSNYRWGVLVKDALLNAERKT